MFTMQGDLFTYPADARVIPTNTQLTRGGKLVMGAGVALQAREKFRGIDAAFGGMQALGGTQTYALQWHDDGWLVAFPTKYHWKDEAHLGLIVTSAIQLRDLADKHEWQQCVLPRVGAGLGGLPWRHVENKLKKVLDDRFIVITQDKES